MRNSPSPLRDIRSKYKVQRPSSLASEPDQVLKVHAPPEPETSARRELVSDRRSLRPFRDEGGPALRVRIIADMGVQRAGNAGRQKLGLDQGNPLHRTEVAGTRLVAEQTEIWRRHECNSKPRQILQQRCTPLAAEAPPGLDKPVLLNAGYNEMSVVPDF